MKIGIGISPSSTSLIRTIQKAADGGGGAAPSNPDFISEWDTTKAGSASDTIVLPLMSAGTYNGTIDWGDASSSALSYANRSHTYASGGVYTITVSGQIEGFTFNNTGDKLKILDISNWGTLALTATSQYFRGCSNLDITATDAPDLSGCTSLQGVFYQCTKLTTCDFSTWNTSTILNMANLFDGCTLFNGLIGDWDVSNVWTLKSILKSASSFNQPLGNWDLSSLINGEDILYGATIFNQNIGAWRAPLCTSFRNAFWDAVAFNNGGSDTTSGWVFASCTNYRDFMRNAQSFNQPLSGLDTSAALNIRNMFYNGSENLAFDQDLSLWDINQVTNLTNFGTGLIGLSTANYDALLIAWAAQGAMSFSGTVNFGGSKYTAGGAAETARTDLIGRWGGITDGGAA